MPGNTVPNSLSGHDLENFHAWLRDECEGSMNPEQLLELWLCVGHKTVPSFMELARKPDKVGFYLAMKGRRNVRPYSLAPALFTTTLMVRSTQKDEEEGNKKPAPFTSGDASQLKTILDPLIADLYAEHQKGGADKSKKAATGPTYASLVTARKIEDHRRRQRDIFTKATGGALWASPKAADGKPILLLSSAATTRPSPNVVAFCRGDVDPDPLELRGAWKRHEGVLHLQVRPDEEDRALTIAKAMGFTPSKAPAPDFVVDPRLIERVRTNQRSHSAIMATGKGYFWWVPAGLLPGEKVLLLSGAPQPDYDRLALPHPNLSGEFRWDRTDRRALLRPKRDPGGGATLGRGLLDHLRTGRAFGGDKVAILAPKAPFPKEGAQDKALAAFLAQVAAFNRSLASTKPKGRFWFAASTANRTPALVLFEAPPLPPRVWDLLDDDPRARTLTGEGAWEKDPKTRAVTFTFDGANGRPGLKRPLGDLLAKMGLFPGQKVEVAR